MQLIDRERNWILHWLLVQKLVSSRSQAQPTSRTDHLPDQSASFGRAPTRRGVEEKLIACECAGWTLASQLTPATVSLLTSKIGAHKTSFIPYLSFFLTASTTAGLHFHYSDMLLTCTTAIITLKLRVYLILSCNIWYLNLRKFHYFANTNA
jgi:hypothetical protein